ADAASHVDDNTRTEPSEHLAVSRVVECEQRVGRGALHRSLTGELQRDLPGPANLCVRADRVAQRTAAALCVRAKRPRFRRCAVLDSRRFVRGPEEWLRGGKPTRARSTPATRGPTGRPPSPTPR